MTIPQKTKTLAFLVRWLLVMNALDAGMTYAFVSAGLARELNPLAAWALAKNPALFVVGKLVLADAAVCFLARYRRIGMLTFGCAFYILLNLRALLLTLP